MIAIPKGLFFCVRLYPNWSAKYTVRDEAGMISFRDYNLQYRGNYQYINYAWIPETIKHVDPDELVELERIIKSLTPDMTQSKLMRRPCDIEIGKMREWYGEDRYLITDNQGFEYARKFERNQKRKAKAVAQSSVI